MALDRIQRWSVRHVAREFRVSTYLRCNVPRVAKPFSVADLLRKRMTAVEAKISALNVEHATLEAELLKLTGAGAVGSLDFGPTLADTVETPEAVPASVSKSRSTK